MSIIIRNYAPGKTVEDESKYELRINDKVIALFSHKRADGLAACLTAAAKAAAHARLCEIAAIIDACEERK